MIVRDDVIVLQQRVLRLTQDVQQLETEFESAVEARCSSSDDVARAAAVREAAVALRKLADARKRLSDAKRALARTQGDEYER